MNKNKHLIIRITESQLKKLTEHLITEEQNKSEFLRTLIEERICRNESNTGKRSKPLKISDITNEINKKQ
jgi:hypothetical protein